MNWASNVAQVLLNTYKQNYSDTLFIFTIFMFMSRPAISTKLIPEKISGNSGMVHFAEINQAPPPSFQILHLK